MLNPHMSWELGQTSDSIDVAADFFWLLDRDEKAIASGRPLGTGGYCRPDPAGLGWMVCRDHGAGGGAPKGTRNGAYTQTLETIINENMLIKDYCGRAAGMITSEKAPLIFSVFKILLRVREIPCLTQSKF